MQALIEQTVGAAPPDEPLLKRAESIILPHVTISGATVEQALKYLQTKSKDSDRYHEGITLQSRLPEDFVKPAISLDLRDVSLTKALRAVAELAGVRVAETKDALVLEAR